MGFAFPAGEAITHSHPSREPKIDDSGVLLVRVFVFFFLSFFLCFFLSFFFFQLRRCVSIVPCQKCS